MYAGLGQEMIDLDELERSAKAVGGCAWTPTYATRTDLARVWLPDGDAVCGCYGNIGHLPEPIDADDVAEFIAASNPATILALITELRTLRAGAARYQWLKPRFRTFSLDMGGQHTYCATGEIGRIRGPNLDMAIDAAIAVRQKEGV